MENQEVLNLVLAKLEKMEAKFDKMEAKFDKMESRMDKMESRMDKMEAKMDKIQEDTKITRSAVNSLIEWADNVSVITNVSFPIKKAK